MRRGGPKRRKKEEEAKGRDMDCELKVLQAKRTQM